VLVGTEDGIRDTVRPRLEAAGADLDRVVALTGKSVDGGSDCPPIFPEDCDLLRETLEETEARMVLIDPLRAFLGGGSGQAIARGLDRIGRVAEHTRANVTLVRHLNKGGRGQQAIYRGNHSIHIIGAARTAFLVGPHPTDEGVRVLACTKNNLVK